jgi:hypothetical protein
MRLALAQPRRVIGTLLIVTGLVLFAMGARYFVWIPDLLGLSTLAPGIALLGLGLWLAPARGFSSWVRSHVGVSYKRDLVLSFAVAALVEAALGPLFYYLSLGVENPLVWQLEGLQNPGASLAMAVYRYAAPHLGRGWSRDLAVACGFIVLIAFWTFGTFVLLSVFRVLRPARSSQQV